METKTVKEPTLKEQAQSNLKKWLRPGSTIYHTVKSVSKSGMSRKISFYIVVDGKIKDINWYLSNLLDYKRDPSNGALKIGGCGMDMGFHIVYSAGRALYPNGFKLAKGQYGRNGDRSGFDKDGGYAFHSEWI